jgi:hypothetical protein
MNGNHGKKRKLELESSPLNPSLFTKENINRLKKQHDHSEPYKHLVISDLCIFDRMKSIHEEAVTNFTATFKETDLFKVYQTGKPAITLADAMILSLIFISIFYLVYRRSWSHRCLRPGTSKSNTKHHQPSKRIEFTRIS